MYLLEIVGVDVQVAEGYVRRAWKKYSCLFLLKNMYVSMSTINEIQFDIAPTCLYVTIKCCHFNGMFDISMKCPWPWIGNPMVIGFNSTLMYHNIVQLLSFLPFQQYWWEYFTQVYQAQYVGKDNENDRICNTMWKTMWLNTGPTHNDRWMMFRLPTEIGPKHSVYYVELPIYIYGSFCSSLLVVHWSHVSFPHAHTCVERV